MATALARLIHRTDDDQQLVGMQIGRIARNYGLLRCEENISIESVFNRAGDLAVADRLAYVYATRLHVQIAVVEHDGWYYAVTLDRPLTNEQAAELSMIGESPRLMSVVSERGIAPVVAPFITE